eukprot:m.1052058 g.1052058  ORF g.1052058 m.1052058 type:complete len:855 (+) comp24182_c0_seq2:422-2986(+)
MSANVPKLKLSKVGVTPSSGSRTGTSGKSDLAVPYGRASGTTTIPKKSAPSTGPASNLNASVRRAKAASNATASVRREPTVSKLRPQQPSYRPPPKDALHASHFATPRRTVPAPVRGARPGAIGVKRDPTVNPPPWKLRAARQAALPTETPNADRTRKNFKPSKKGVKTATDDLPLGVSTHDVDMIHHRRRVAAARPTINNSVPKGMHAGPLGRHAKPSTSRPRRTSSTAGPKGSSRRSSSASMTGKMTSHGKATATTWVPQSNRSAPGYADPCKALFSITVPTTLARDASTGDPSGLYVFDREGARGPVFRHHYDRRWKLAKGALNADGLFTNAADIGSGDAWYLYNITNWLAVVQSPHMSSGFETDPRPERLRWWPPPERGWCTVRGRAVDHMRGCDDAGAVVIRLVDATEAAQLMTAVPPTAVSGTGNAQMAAALGVVRDGGRGSHEPPHNDVSRPAGEQTLVDSANADPAMPKRSFESSAIEDLEDSLALRQPASPPAPSPGAAPTTDPQQLHTQPPAPVGTATMPLTNLRAIGADGEHGTPDTSASAAVPSSEPDVSAVTTALGDITMFGDTTACASSGVPWTPARNLSNDAHTLSTFHSPLGHSTGVDSRHGHMSYDGAATTGPPTQSNLYRNANGVTGHYPYQTTPHPYQTTPHPYQATPHPYQATMSPGEMFRTTAAWPTPGGASGGMSTPHRTMNLDDLDPSTLSHSSPQELLSSTMLSSPPTGFESRLPTFEPHSVHSTALVQPSHGSTRMQSTLQHQQQRNTPTAPTDADYVAFKTAITKDVLAHDLDTDEAIKTLCKRHITRELGVSSDGTKRRADGSLRLALDEVRMRSCVSDLLDALRTT